jgi:hypothetical integral membrane protein (TIGR02206 family)
MPQFSDPHLAALAVLVVTAAVGVWIARRHPGRPATVFAWAVAAMILAAWAGEYVADVADGIWSVRYDLPLQLTDAVSIAAALALLTRRPLLAELTYFWALSASLQATLTPDLGQNFPSVFYFTYFGYHIGAIVAGCVLVFGCAMYPRRHGAWRAFAAALIVAAVAGTADLVTGGNYMYLRAKPQHNSLLGLMGPWPWYVIGGALLGLAILFALRWLAGWIGRRDHLVAGGLAPAAPPSAGPAPPVGRERRENVSVTRPRQP